MVSRAGVGVYVKRHTVGDRRPQQVKRQPHHPVGTHGCHFNGDRERRLATRLTSSALEALPSHLLRT
jgi:hypothetical protein